MAEVYFYPLDAASRVGFEDAYKRLALEYEGGPLTLAVGSRQLSLPYVAGPIARTSFADLCGKALGASDYLALADRFSVLALDAVPALTHDMRNEASRFEVLIDTLYEAETLLIMRSAVDIDQLDQGLNSAEFPALYRACKKCVAAPTLTMRLQKPKPGKNKGKDQQKNRFHQNDRHQFGFRPKQRPHVGF